MQEVENEGGGVADGRGDELTVGAGAGQVDGLHGLPLVHAAVSLRSRTAARREVEATVAPVDGQTWRHTSNGSVGW